MRNFRLLFFVFPLIVFLFSAITAEAKGGGSGGRTSSGSTSSSSGSSGTKGNGSSSSGSGTTKGGAGGVEVVLAKGTIAAAAPKTPAATDVQVKGGSSGFSSTRSSVSYGRAGVIYDYEIMDTYWYSNHYSYVARPFIWGPSPTYIIVYDQPHAGRQVGGGT
ncbi:hypothetical protein M422DRAFT_40681 [Sphaerobolus stellatus SS14]|nr:hypothetical protein M422DRAFT_40681 [Sphaerobolus stellatus SS14]